METTEIEIKFPLQDSGIITRKLRKLKARDMGKNFERNITFGDYKGQFGFNGKLLRLRKDAKARLTIKDLPEEGPFKRLREFEVVVSDFDTAKRILEEMGFWKVWEYQKYRRTFSLGRAHVMIDKLPFGSFVEIEGPEEEIIKAAGSLGLDLKEGTRKNYAELYIEYCKKRKIKFSDLVFR